MLTKDLLKTAMVALFFLLCGCEQDIEQTAQSDRVNVRPGYVYVSDDTAGGYVQDTGYEQSWYDMAMDVKEMECLALNIYHEARGESIKEQAAVAMVTLNRVASARFPSTICGVVYSPYAFSWTGDRSVRDVVSEPYRLKLAREIARRAINGHIRDVSNGADHYYAHSMEKPPSWASAGVEVASMRGHRYLNLYNNH